MKEEPQTATTLGPEKKKVALPCQTEEVECESCQNRTQHTIAQSEPGATGLASSVRLIVEPCTGQVSAQKVVLNTFSAPYCTPHVKFGFDVSVVADMHTPYACSKLSKCASKRALYL